MFSLDVLEIDAEATARAIEDKIREQVKGVLRRKGVVVAMSGGVDSSVVAGLCSRALGPKQVLGLFLPERDSSPENIPLAASVAERFAIETVTEEIGGALEALGCYRRRDQAIRSLFPEYGPGYKQKIVLPQNLLDSDRLNFYSLIVETPAGEQKRARLPTAAYLQIVAATNMKQRTRKLLEYYHAERLNYVVAGTPNRLEYDQGFFVKGGDGLADIKPIAHLYKTQVYSLARHIGVPEGVTARPPTTDTYSIPQTQEEFYFCLPYHRMDLLLWAQNHGVAAAEAAGVMGLSAAQVERVYRDIDSKRRTTRYLHLKPLLVEEM